MPGVRSALGHAKGQREVIDNSNNPRIERVSAPEKVPVRGAECLPFQKQDVGARLDLDRGYRPPSPRPSDVAWDLVQLPEVLRDALCLACPVVGPSS